MSKNKTSGNLPGQQVMDVTAARMPTTVKAAVPMPPTVAPAKVATPAPTVETEEKKESAVHYVPGETVTEEEWARMSEQEKAQYTAEKEEYFREKQRKEKARAKELKEKLVAIQTSDEVTPPISSIPEAPAEEDEYIDEVFNEEDFKKSGKYKKARKICRKYRIKPKELQRGIEKARSLFVPQMMKTEKQSIVLAIIDLLEFGDIK